MSLPEEKIKALIQNSFEVETQAHLDEQEFITLLSQRVAEMMDSEMDLLLSTLYRLDVLEWKIDAALKNPMVPPHIGIARLIWDRQKERLETREKYSSGTHFDWDPQ